MLRFRFFSSTLSSFPSIWTRNLHQRRVDGGEKGKFVIGKFADSFWCGNQFFPSGLHEVTPRYSRKLSSSQSLIARLYFLWILSSSMINSGCSFLSQRVVSISSMMGILKHQKVEIFHESKFMSIFMMEPLTSCTHEWWSTFFFFFYRDVFILQGCSGWGNQLEVLESLFIAAIVWFSFLPFALLCTHSPSFLPLCVILYERYTQQHNLISLSH